MRQSLTSLAAASGGGTAASSQAGKRLPNKYDGRVFQSSAVLEVPGPGSYADSGNHTIAGTSEHISKKNEIVAKKVLLNERLKSKLSQHVRKAVPASRDSKADANADLTMEDTPLIQIYERLKKSPKRVPFESPDISMIKERSPNPIISRHKYSNPLGQSAQSFHKSQTQLPADAPTEQPAVAGQQPGKPQTISEAFIRQVDRFITNKATIQDESRVQKQLGEDAEFQALQPNPFTQQRNTSMNSTLYMERSAAGDDSLSSRVHSVNTLAHKLEVMRRHSKNSPGFHKKSNASILRPESSGTGASPLKLISTPSIPMPERFYYEQNPSLLELKRKQMDDKQKHGVGPQAQVGGGGGSFKNFKRVSSLDHLQMIATANAKRTAELKQQLGMAEQQVDKRLMRQHLQERTLVARTPGPQDYQPENTVSQVVKQLESKQKIHNNSEGAWI